MAGILLCASIVLGGGTRAGFLGDVVLQLLAIPILMVGIGKGLRAGGDGRLGAGGRAATLIAALAVGIPLLQLIPLPPSIWTLLPGHRLIEEALVGAGGGAGWRPATVSTDATWLGALSLLAPLALFSLALRLGYRERRQLVLVLLAAVLASAVLGLMQVAQGPDSPLRFFEFTNLTEAVGFFANRNHFSALLYAGLLLALPWTVVAARELAGATGRRKVDALVVLPAMAAFTVLVLLISAQLMARSRGGLALTIAALLGGFLLSASDRRREGMSARRLLAAASTLAIVFSAQFALFRIMERLGADPLKDARIPFARNTIEAALAFMPFGAGAGTFVPVYATFEKPADTLVAYANRAHNDFLELWLETGLAGMVLALAFLAWLAGRTVSAWRAAPEGAEPIDRLIARAATMVVVLLLAHSIVDYPLRTSAMLAVFAMSCALLVEPSQAARAHDRHGSGARGREARPRHARAGDGRRTPARMKAGEPVVPTQTAPVRPSGRREMERWSTDQAWPEAWEPSGESSKSRNGQSGPENS